LISTLYLDKFPNAPLFLTLSIIVNLLAFFGNLSLGSFLQGLGETRMAMNLGILTTAFGLPLGFILIPAYGVLGVIIGNSVSGIPSMLWGLYWVWKHYEAKAELHSSAKIFSASALAAIPPLLITSFLHTAALSARALALIQLVIGLAVFLCFYVFGAPLIGAVSQSDVDTIRDMFSGLGIVSKIINILLTTAEKIIQTKTTRKHKN
jgi:O-antigen/teichoic acid export membrane protein